MAKRKKQDKTAEAATITASTAKTSKKISERKNDYLWSMSHAPRIDDNIHWFQLLIISFFSAFIIMIVHQASYKRPMDQFYWTNSNGSLADFFSYYKMIAILTCCILVLLLLAYRVFAQSLAIKRTSVYIPMLIYTLMVLISYACSDYKEFSWLGWNDRFEGTAVLLSYMVLLFYIINSINTERAVKWVLYPIGISSTLMGLIGMSQATNHDFFRTNLGQKLLVPNVLTTSGSSTWDLIDQATKAGEQYLQFTFQNKEIYQTVYNINYVSFYLTLLIPIFGLLFIYTMMKGSEEKLWKKILYGVLFALLIFNLIGSASSGGFFGMAVVVVLALVILNKKILTWWKPLSILIIITLLVSGITYDRWFPELSNTFKVMHSDASTNIAQSTNNSSTDSAIQGHLDYFQTKSDDIILGYNGEKITFTTDPQDPLAISAQDSSNTEIALKAETTGYQLDDKRFEGITIRPVQDTSHTIYIVINVNGTDWPFLPDKNGVKFVNGIRKQVSLDITPSFGWENNQGFGSGRGYIWSRSIPMMKSTIFIGHGADTYCIYFPQNDYVGKYNSGFFTADTNIIVDKPHNMYMGMWIGTGGVSAIAFLALLILYFIQSMRIFWRRNYDSFLSFSGMGIFLGIMGFAFTGFVDDSSVSVMPMFYGLLGTGIAINMMLKKDKDIQV